jgi:hypothetical protein
MRLRLIAQFFVIAARDTQVFQLKWPIDIDPNARGTESRPVIRDRVVC